MKHPLTLKLAALAAIVCLLLVGLGLVHDVVRDRQRHGELARHSVAQSLAGPQTLLGPLIHIACVETWDLITGTGVERHVAEQRREFLLTALPQRLEIQGKATPQTRTRGIFTVPSYQLQGSFVAQWAHLNELRPSPSIPNGRVNCGAPILMLAVSDARGLRHARVQWNEHTLDLKPGTFHPVYTRGLHTSLPDSVRQPNQPLALTLELELLGTEQLSLIPLGDNTEVTLDSAWPHPSFGGRFLPSEREVRADGFKAQWRLSSLATSAGQDVRAHKKPCGWTSDDEGLNAGASDCLDSFGVSLIEPVNLYSLSDRALKYGLLFITLTFVAVGLVELLQGRRVHPVQYLLVGSALCSFFLLLVSLSEHLGFAWAYAAAASACVLLLGHYASHMLGSWRGGLALGAGMAVLYGLLYLLLRLEQTALVVGALALFAVLAAVMVLTRRINWYRLGQSKPTGEAAA